MAHELEVGAAARSGEVAAGNCADGVVVHTSSFPRIEVDSKTGYDRGSRRSLDYLIRPQQERMGNRQAESLGVFEHGHRPRHLLPAGLARASLSLRGHRRAGRRSRRLSHIPSSVKEDYQCLRASRHSCCLLLWSPLARLWTAPTGGSLASPRTSSSVTRTYAADDHRAVPRRDGCRNARSRRAQGLRSAQVARRVQRRRPRSPSIG